MAEQRDEIMQQMEAMQQRLDVLERDNQRLRERLEPFAGPDNPCFHPMVFQRALARVFLTVMLPAFLCPALAIVALRVYHLPVMGVRIGPVPLVDLAGTGSGIPGIGLGIFAMGGLSIGIFAFGGMSVGVVAMGGSSIGLIAFGGGSVGRIACGGGACGYIAIGGGAVGRYALGGRAYGQRALGINRQDTEAIDFFVRFFPWLRAAVTTAMPVILVKADAAEHAH